MSQTIASDPKKLRHHLRLVSADGLKMATPDLPADKWPEIGEEAKRKDLLKNDTLKDLRKALEDKNLDHLQVLNPQKRGDNLRGYETPILT